MRRTTLAIVAAAFAVGLAPDRVIAPSAWAAENLVVADGPYAGERWSPTKAPFLREIIDCLAPDHPATRVVVRKSAQVGFTGAALAWIGSIADVAPGSTLIVQPTVDLAKGFNREKLEPTIENSPRLRGRIADQKNRSGEGSTALFKRFPGGFLVLTGANSSVQLRSRTIKNVFADEIDDWPDDLDGQGDPMGMVDARQISFHAVGTHKKLEGSTPKNKGSSRVDAGFEAGDQRYYEVPCPHCTAMQPFDWDRLVWDETPPHNARYACRECGALIEHRQKAAMLAGGRWTAAAPGPGRHPSFHLNALYSPFTTWDEMVKAHVAARDNPLKLKTWWNLWRGESWEERGDVPSEDQLFDRRVAYPASRVPPGALFLTGAADVQSDRIEWAVYAWSAVFTSWIVDRGVIEGDTSAPEIWTYLSDVVNRTYEDRWGKAWDIDGFGVDAGYLSQKVYAFVRRHLRTAQDTRRVFALKGKPGWRLPPLGTPGTLDVDFAGRKIGAVQVWPVGTWDMKSELYGALRKTIEGPGPDGSPRPGAAIFNETVDRVFFERLTAEQLVHQPSKSGLIEKVWVLPRGKRNEDLDVAVYARAIAHHFADGLSAEQWANLAARRWTQPQDVQMDLARLWAPGLAGPTELPPAAAGDPLPAEEPATNGVRGRGMNGGRSLSGQGRRLG